MGGFGGGFLQGFADSYAKEHKAKLDRNLAQRGQLADLGMRALENARPESQIRIITNLSRLVSSDPNKKLDKDLMDIGSWLGPPEGYGETQSSPAPKEFTPGSEMVPGRQQQSPAMMGPPTPLRGAGMAPVQINGRSMGGGASTGTALAPPPDSLRGPEYRMTSTEGEGSLAGMSPFQGPRPPAWAPFYSPEEKMQMESAGQASKSAATIRGEYGARRQEGEALIAAGQMQPDELPAFIAGRANLTARLQPRNFTDPQGNVVQLSFNPLEGIYTNQNGEQVDITGYTPVVAGTANRLGDIVPDEQSKTGWGRKIYDRAGNVVRIEHEAAPPPAYAPTDTTRESVQLVQSGDQTVPVGLTETTRTQRSVPGKELPKQATPGMKVLGEGLPLPLTAQARSKEEAKTFVVPGISMMQQLGKRVITEKQAVIQRAKASGRSVEAALGNDPDYLGYQAGRFSLAGNLAVLQQGSRPSDTDIAKIWLPLVPDVFSDPVDSAKLKWFMIKVQSGTPFEQGEAPEWYKAPAAPLRNNVSRGTNGADAGDQEWSSGAWQRANPQGDLAAAIAAAKAAGHKVVP